MRSVSARRSATPYAIKAGWLDWLAGSSVPSPAVQLTTHLGHLDKVRIDHVRVAVALLVKEILPLLYHTLEVVVEDQHLHSSRANERNM